MNYQLCHKCWYWFDIDNPQKDFGVVYFHGQVEKYTCPGCTHQGTVRREEKGAIND